LWLRKVEVGSGKIIAHNGKIKISTLNYLKEMERISNEMMQETINKISKMESEYFKKEEMHLTSLKEEHDEIFLRKMEVFFLEWHEQKKSWEDTLLKNASEIVSLTLKEILSHIPKEIKIETMLRMLIKKPIESESTIICSSEMRELVLNSLSKHMHLPFKLEGIDGMTQDLIIIRNKFYDLNLSWDSVISHYSSK